MYSTNISCPNHGDFPLFTNSLCVSPRLYTSLLLLSIILASLSFIMLIVLILLLIYRRQLKRLEQYYDELSTPDVIDSEKQNIKTNTSGRKSEKDISNVLRHIVNSTPLEGARQVHLHHSFPLPTIDESLLVSSGSFEDSYTTNHHPMESQSPTRTIISPMSESTGKMPLITPTHSTNIYSTRL